MKKLWLVGVVIILFLLGCLNPSNPGGNSDDGNVFTTRWNTSNTNGSYASGESNSNQIKLPLYQNGRYHFIVDWGDSSRSTITSHDQAEITHTYAASGEYIVKISGTIEGFGFWREAGDEKKVVGDSAKLLEVRQWGPVKLHSHGGQFIHANNLSGFPATDTLDVSNVTDMNHMFYGTSFSFNQPLNSWDVSNVTDMSHMFADAYAFNQPLNDWDVGNVTDMSFMFSGSISVTSSFNQPLNSWDVSSVADMGSMFRYARRFNQDISSWDVSNVTDMNHMFGSASAFNRPLNSWDVSNVTDMSSMFRYAIAFNQPLNSWDVSSVTDMNYMFRSASAFNQPLNSWNVSSVTDMSYMFNRASLFNQNISNWNVDSVSSFTGIFNGATEMNKNPLYKPQKFR